MKGLTGWESFVYYAVNIMTLGIPFVYKVIIKKAIAETKDGKG